jgi:hypothetical protein
MVQKGSLTQCSHPPKQTTYENTFDPRQYEILTMKSSCGLCGKILTVHLYNTKNQSMWCQYDHTHPMFG